MAYIKVNWTTTTARSTDNLDHMETQYEEAVAEGFIIRASDNTEIRTEVLTSLPVAGSAGRLVYSSGDEYLYVDSGSQWQPVGGKLEYIYGGGDNQYVLRHNIFDFDRAGRTVTVYGNTIRAILANSDYVYIGGDVRRIHRHHQWNMVYDTMSAPASAGDIYDMAMDANYIYVARTGGAGDRKLDRHNKATLAYVDQTSDMGANARRVRIDASYIYVAAGNYVYRFNIADLSDTVDPATADYGGTLLALDIDDDYIYAGGATTNRVRRYNKATLAYVDQTDAAGGTISGIYVDGSHIYASVGTIDRVNRYNKVTMAYIDQTPVYGGSIHDIAGDGNYIYAGGVTTQRIRQYRKSDLTLKDETESLGGTVFAVVTE